MDKLCLSGELQGEGGESIAEDRNRDNQTKKRKKKKLRGFDTNPNLCYPCVQKVKCAATFFWESLLIRCLTAVTALPVHLFIHF